MRFALRSLALSTAIMGSVAMLATPAAADEPQFAEVYSVLSQNAGVDLSKLAAFEQFVNDMVPDQTPTVSTDGQWPDIDIYETKTAYGSSTRENGDPFIASIADNVHVHHNWAGLDQYVEWEGKSYVAWLGANPWNANVINQHDEFSIRTVFGGASLSWPPGIELTDGKDDEFNAPNRTNQWESRNHYDEIRLDGMYIYSANHVTRGYFVLGVDGYRVEAEYGFAV